ncbi:glutaredoxin family protein [Psychromonas hadalis]|uniref:glutaredoxin family protein n=1 Tax=Psychromonas hadalis TaxID=211669 RepID=UPI0003B68F38|nr:glutaredoxin family protein [Psychromonas hadalis]
MTNRLRFYYTDGCHLCDDALVLLAQLNLTFVKVDIVEKQALIALYGTLIPVVENESGSTLNWPFSLQQLQNFISNQKG